MQVSGEPERNHSLWPDLTAFRVGGQARVLVPSNYTAPDSPQSGDTVTITGVATTPAMHHLADYYDPDRRLGRTVSPDGIVLATGTSSRHWHYGPDQLEPID